MTCLCFIAGKIISMAQSYLVVLLDLYQSVLLPSSLAWVTLLDRTTGAPPVPPGGAGARPFLCAAGRRRASRADMAARATGLLDSCGSPFMTERLSSEAVLLRSSCVVSITNEPSPPVVKFGVNLRGLPYKTSAKFSDFLTPPPLVTVTNQLILFLLSAFWGLFIQRRAQRTFEVSTQ